MRDYQAWHAWLEAVRAQPFAWGTNDCVTFAARSVRVLTGRNPLKGIARWQTEGSALLALARAGGIDAAVSGVLAEVPLALAHRGDVGLVEDERGRYLMVIEATTLVGPGIEGLMHLPRTRLLRAWSAES